MASDERLLLQLLQFLQLLLLLQLLQLLQPLQLLLFFELLELGFSTFIRWLIGDCVGLDCILQCISRLSDIVFGWGDIRYHDGFGVATKGVLHQFCQDMQVVGDCRPAA